MKKIIITGLIALALTAGAVQLAYLERGYFAIGGEWFTGIVTFLVSYWEEVM